jgi:hypothetical protein
MKRAAFEQFCARYRRILASAFPDTEGWSQNVHNWYRFSKDRSEHDCADALLSAERDWWHTIEDRIDRWYDQAEHRNHLMLGFRPIWCAECQQAKRRKTSRRAA